MACMLLKHLPDRILLSNLGVTIPWLITEPELFQIVPETAFARSIANWPMLRCTVLGIDLEWGFNFVTHSNDRFIGVRYDNGDAETSNKAFAAASTQLSAELGRPNLFDLADRSQGWQDDWVCVSNKISTPEEPDGRDVLRRALVIYAHSANPDIFAFQRGRTPGNRI